MRRKIKLFSLLVLFSFCMTQLLSAVASVEDYDLLLAKLEEKKNSEPPKHQDAEEPYDKWTFSFDRSKFPLLDGTWLVNRATIKRQGELVIEKPITLDHCNARIPFEKRDFKDKEVIISSRGPDIFFVNAKYPITDDIYYDPNQQIELKYQNFGFKAVIDPHDLTYSYTEKHHGFMRDPSVVRQLWLNGRLQYESISPWKIVARGYEIEHSPECIGFIRDEVEFVFERKKDADFGPDEPIPFLEQPAYAKGWPAVEIPEGPLAGEKTYLISLDSAKDKSNFVVSPVYEPFDSTKKPPLMKKSTYEKKKMVPGLW